MFKRILKIVRNVLIVLILLGVAGYFAIQTPTVQTWLSKRIAAYISGELGAKVEVGKVSIDLWARLVIEDLYIEDQHQDTLLFVKSLHVRSYKLDKTTGEFRVGSAELFEPDFHLKRYASDSLLNYAFILDYIDSFSDTLDTSAASNVRVGNLKLINGRFIYENEHRAPRGVYGLDWNHMLISNLNLEIEDFLSAGDSIMANIQHISGNDISGFEVKGFESNLKIIPGEVILADANIETNYSAIRGDLDFFLQTIDDLDYFEQKVRMKHEFKDAKLRLADLAYFVSDLEGWENDVIISGKVTGTVERLKGKNLRLQLDENTFFKGDFDMDGLPNIDETFISLNIRELTSNKWELEKLQVPPFKDRIKLETPDNFSVLGQMVFTGNFTGFINDFVAYGKLKTAIGNVEGDVSFKEDFKINDYVYQGNVKTEEFDLGKFYSDGNIGVVSSDVYIDGAGLSVDNLDLSFKGEISKLVANKYAYTNIRTDGTFKERYFDGEFFIRDPNVEIDFIGQVDFRKKTAILDFYSDIHHVNLKEINVLTEYGYSSLSGEIDVRSEGLDFSNFIGTISARDVTYCAKSKDYYLGRFNIKAERKNQVRFTLDSDIALASIEGQFDVSELGASMEEIISAIIPSYNPPDRNHRTQRFDLNLRILDFNQISEVFIPELSIAPQTKIDFTVDESSNFFEINVTSGKVKYLNNELKSFTLDARKPDEFLYISLISDGLQIGKDLKFDDFAIDTRTEKDTIFTAIAWGNNNSIHRGDVNGKLAVRGFQNFDFKFDKSNIKVKDQSWMFHPNALLKMDSSRYELTQFQVYNGNQRLSLDGIISEDPSDQLKIELNALDISNVNSFTGGEPNFYGLVSGSAALRGVYDQAIFTSDLTLVDFKLNDYLVGDVCVESTFENATKRIRLDGDIEKNKLQPLAFAGYYKLSDKESPLDIIATIQDFDLAFINEFLGEGILDIQGKTSGTIAITGKPEFPQMNGTAYLNNASIYVDYLNTRYKIEEEVGIYPDMFTFDHIRIRDEENAPGFLTGTILHNAFGDWNFDVMIDMDDRMLAMNTTSEMNSMYYGKAYTKGYVNIFGYEDQLEFDINLKTERGTQLNMPMTDDVEEGLGSFIRFVKKDTVTAAEPLDLSGIKLKFDLDITPEAEFQIIFDEAVGDIMKGTGKGHLNMEINNLSSFNMYGAVELSKGNYLFTLKNMLNKEFSVRPGGTISWYGDPFGAELNLKAVYKVSASLTDILPDAVSETGQRVPVDLIMNLTGKMFNPGIGFEIELPTVDEVTKSRVQANISTDQERNRQAFALLVLRRFVSPPNINSSGGYGRALTENSTELLSSQISNWLSQISDDFNLGFNYRPGDEISNEEIALALSTQFFNDRLMFSSNVGVSRGTSANQNPSNLIGDVRLEYKITPEGKIRLVVYNESNDFRMITTQQSLYTQGVGVLYQEEFDNLDEFFCGFKNLFRKKEEQVKCN